MRLLKLFVVVVALAAAGGARGEDYSNLVDKGEFFLAKGASYMPDAVRSLEQAAEADPKRAATDPRFVAAMAKAYFESSRLSEAYQWILALDEAKVSDPKVEALRDHMLKEAGVGRFRFTAKVPAHGVTAALKAAADTRLDAPSKKILEKLNLFLQKPFAIGKNGFTVLAPEGKLILESSAPIGQDGVFQKTFEIYVGDEIEQHVVAAYPARDQWRVKPGNRVLELGWPSADKASFKLARALGDKPMQVICEGTENSCVDNGTLPGVEAVYALYTYGEDGLLWSISRISATSKPPVTEVRAKAHFASDLSVLLDWELGDGSVDRLVIRKAERGEEKTVVDQKGEEIMRSGEITDGPIFPSAAPQPLVYTIEAQVEGEKEPARAKVALTIPAQVARIDSVKEQFTPDRVFVEWETFPRDGIAEGYNVYLLKEHNGMGELMGTVADASAREFSYFPKTMEQPAAQWKHRVVPYLGKKFLVDLVPIEARDKVPEKDMSRHLSRLRRIPNMILSWEAVPGVSRYVVRLTGRKEYIVRDTYIELSGLQANFTDTGGDIRVFALTDDGSLSMILSMSLAYSRYRVQETQEDTDEKVSE